MAEISNKQTRSTGTRTRSTGSVKRPDASSRGRNGNVAPRLSNGSNNGNQVERRTRQDKHMKSYTAPDSESDFRASRQSSGSSFFTDNMQFNDHSRANGNRARNGNHKRHDGNRRNQPNRSVQNGQQWSPSDAGYHTGMHELRGSDWYREDQARYAAQQIANERNLAEGSDGEVNGAPKTTDGKRTSNQRNRPRRRPANQRNGNAQHARTDGNRGDQKSNGKPARPPNAKKLNHPSRARPGNNNGITPTTATPSANADAISEKKAVADDTTSSSIESTTDTQDNDASSREHTKARRAPWRTQKHGTRRKTPGPSPS